MHPFIEGYITRIRPSRQMPVPIVEKIPLALCMWLNLRKITITPKKVTGDGFRNIIATLKSCKSLKSLTINEFAMEEEALVSELVQLDSLDEIVLFGPTGALFRKINGWISNIQGTISTLNFVVRIFLSHLLLFFIIII
ncbi:MAG TPA: hypothetical protein VGO47_14955 [Chlamydiales bacterium]|jgi:hypothetical protein|nr:hypothetical protein [Chlamydiales bacterium]